MPRLSTLSNPTGLVDLDRKRISLVIDETGKSFAFSLARLDLTDLTLPSLLNVVVIARRGNSEERVELGAVSNWDKSYRPLTELADDGTWTFRVLLVQPGAAKLVAAAENVRPDGLGESASFIALEPADLGQRPWAISILELDGRAVIRFSKDIYRSAAEAYADEIFIALILPEAIQRLADWIAENIGVLEDPVWEPFKSWLALHGITDEPDEDSVESQREWSDKVVNAFCNRFEFVSELVELRKKGHEE